MYQAVQKLRSRGDIFDQDYDILFDGFPRSGNTFGSFMLLESQQNRIKVATHRHTPPPLIRAAALHKPACVTLRRPLDAISSWVIYTNRSIRAVIQYYLDFYQALLSHRSHLLILPFFVITEDFPLVIQLINTRFGMNLESQFDFDACKSEVFRRIDNRWRNENGVVNEYRVARPYPARDSRKAALRNELLQRQYSKLLRRCEDLYQIYEHEFIMELNHRHGAQPRQGKITSYLGNILQLDILGGTSQEEYVA